MVLKVRTALNSGVMTQATTVFLWTSRPAQWVLTTSMLEPLEPAPNWRVTFTIKNFLYVLPT